MQLGRVLAQHVHVKYFATELEQYLDRQEEFLQLVNDNCPDSHYKKVVLKWFMNVADHAGVPVYDELQVDYAMALMAPSPTSTSKRVDYKYETGAVAIKEDPWVIAQHGSTGHRTWEAALALGDYLFEYGAPSSFLELGAGTGFVGMLSAKLGSTKGMVTDGDEEVVQCLNQNIALNALGEFVSAEKLYWGVDMVDHVGSECAILCADVTYNSDSFPSLVGCIKDLLIRGSKYALLSATMRSQETFDSFKQCCDEQGLNMDLLKTYQSPFTECRFFIPPESPEIVIYKLHG